MVEIRDENAFRREVLEARGPTVVLFWATWCPFCRRFKPEFDRLGSDLDVRLATVFLDDQENPLWEDYAVDVVPTIALFRDGDLVDRQDGVLGYGLDRSSVQAFVGRIARLLA
ncbi:MAG: thioredoxin family protein [Methanobacteriota archaeon]